MGNSCGIVTAKKVVTLGGTRNTISTSQKSRLPKTKENSEKETLRNETYLKETDLKQQQTNTGTTEKQYTRRESKASTISKVKSVVVNNNKIHHSLPCSTTQTLPKISNKLLRQKQFQHNVRLRKKRNSKKMILCKSSSTSSAGESNIRNHVSSMKNKETKKQENFDQNCQWDKEESRLLTEFNHVEGRIRNALLLEQRAKVEVQMWRSKLERIALEQRERLFRQAGSLKYKLRNAENLLCYHELREKRMKATNDKMKGLIDNVKEEARSLRVESEKRRLATQRNFDLKLSTIAGDLNRIKSKMETTGRLSCKLTSSDSETAFSSALKPLPDPITACYGKNTIKPRREDIYPTVLPTLDKLNLMHYRQKHPIRTQSLTSRYDLAHLAHYSRHCNAKFANCSPTTHTSKINSELSDTSQIIPQRSQSKTLKSKSPCSSGKEHVNDENCEKGRDRIFDNLMAFQDRKEVSSTKHDSSTCNFLRTASPSCINEDRNDMSITDGASSRRSCRYSNSSSQITQATGSGNSFSSTPLHNYLTHHSPCGSSTFSVYSGRIRQDYSCDQKIQTKTSPSRSDGRYSANLASCISPVSSNCVKMTNNNNDVTAENRITARNSFSRYSSTYPSSC